MYFAECQLVDTRQSMLCRVPVVWHSATKCKLIFAECHLDDTRQRLLCRLSPIWHSAKRILKIKKNLCRVPDHGHSAKHAYIATVRLFFLTLFSLSTSRRAVAASLSNAGRRPRPHPRPRTHKMGLEWKKHQHLVDFIVQMFLRTACGYMLCPHEFLGYLVYY
jgi:hypothetical protein